jgi:aminoglycoside phosphotransferase (APT) family kinase protein
MTERGRSTTQGFFCVPVIDNHALARIAHRLDPHSRVQRSWALSGGMSATMTALEIVGGDGSTRPVIVRRPGAAALALNPQAAEDEFRLLQVTQSLGLATPAPYDLDQPGTILDTPYLVTEYIAGEPQFAPTDAADFARQFATHLATIHRANLSRHDVSFLRTHPDGCRENDRASPNGADRLFDVARVRRLLATATLARRNAPALLHGDYWPGNVLWRDGRIVAVVDWEDACVGDPLIDLAIARLDLLWLFGDDALEQFMQQYRAHLPIDVADLPYWDVCAALRLARLAGNDLQAWTAFFAPYGRPDITEHSFREHMRWFVAQALDQLANGAGDRAES